MSEANKERFCSFCGQSQHTARKLLAGKDANICDKCVLMAVDTLITLPAIEFKPGSAP